ncbi:hypothetical protein ACFQX6_44905 [Streptosporangium lutulentum]
MLGGTLIGSRLGRIWHETRKGGRSWPEAEASRSARSSWPSAS